jgi:hypothetical protein
VSSIDEKNTSRFRPHFSIPNSTCPLQLWIGFPAHTTIYLQDDRATNSDFVAQPLACFLVKILGKLALSGILGHKLELREMMSDDCK